MKTLTTERLLLRSIQMEDAEDFLEYFKNPNVGPNAGWEPITDRAEVESVLQKLIEEDIYWAIVYKDSNKVIGSIGLHPDKKRGDVSAKMLTYDLSEDFWNRGLMTEAVKRTIQYVFEEMNLDVLSVYHYPFNKASGRVIEKSGFHQEGTLRHAVKIYNGNVYAVVCYSILKSEYLSKQA